MQLKRATQGFLFIFWRYFAISKKFPTFFVENLTKKMLTKIIGVKSLLQLPINVIIQPWFFYNQFCVIWKKIHQKKGKKNHGTLHYIMKNTLQKYVTLRNVLIIAQVMLHPTKAW
jgi:hypothetical protein